MKHEDAAPERIFLHRIPKGGGRTRWSFTWFDYAEPTAAEYVRADAVPGDLQRLKARVVALEAEIEGWRRYKASVDEAVLSHGSYRP